MHAYYAYLCLKPDEADLFCGFFPTYLALLADGYRVSIPGVCIQQNFVSRCVVEFFALTIWASSCWAAWLPRFLQISQARVHAPAAHVLNVHFEVTVVRHHALFGFSSRQGMRYHQWEADSVRREATVGAREGTAVLAGSPIDTPSLAGLAAVTFGGPVGRCH